MSKRPLDPAAYGLGDDEEESANGSPGGLPEILNPSSWRGTFLSWAPVGIAPALLAFAAAPDRLAWTSKLSANFFSLASPLYDEFAALEGYGEALEIALLDLRGSPQRILDVATGTGFAARRLKKQYPHADVLGIDLSRQMVKIARADAAKEGLDITFAVGDAAQLDLDDDAFDLVICHNAPPFCDEALRVLRPRGTALIAYSFGGPWVELAWRAVAGRLESSGASHTRGRRAGFGFYGIARKRG
ncbi:MAG TPA: class I SAM-dependent methyltransferase [Actinomycetota bacterium]|nr:class I SAM-dependent methyltransferase [Actinomycetota bacterium]